MPLGPWPTSRLCPLVLLELGNFIAGPTAGRLLADFGADVIKVERPRTGDELRRWRLYAGSTSMLYRTINRNKRSVVLDLRSDAGRAAVLRLAEHCDVLIENFRPGTLEKWGLGPEELSAPNPEIILIRISAFGQSGPASQQPGFAAVAEAVGGLRELVGEPDRQSVRIGVSIGDSIAGLYGAFGAMLALYQRESRRSQSDRSDSLVTLSTRERVVDVALNEAVFSMMESLIPDHLAHGVERTRLGGRVEGIAPSNAYLCGDHTSVVIAGNGDGIFRRLMDVIDRPDLGEDDNLAANSGRWARRDELDDAIGAWTATLPRAEVLAALARAGIPAGPIYTAADICADEQYLARNMIQYFEVDTGEPAPRSVGFPGVVPVIGDASLPVRWIGPDLGADTEEVLADLLGMGPDEIDACAGTRAPA
jgi:formyl-CoA transferase